jgi:putative AdoMet-dependent methyltransferase
MTNPERRTLFEAWAASYAADLAQPSAFPFAGYDAVLDAVVEAADLRPELPVLELGTGTGNLALRLVQHTPSIALTAVDFADEMLAQARRKVPSATFQPLDLSASTWPALQGQRFARVVAAYVLHEFPLDEVAALLQRLREEHGRSECRIVIGDIAFPNAQMRAEAHAYWHNRWDDNEFYFAADEALPTFQRIGFQASYQQLSVCAGVFVLDAL